MLQFNKYWDFLYRR